MSGADTPFALCPSCGIPWAEHLPDDGCPVVSPPELRCECAWCHTELRPGREPTTHGICDDCRQLHFGEFCDTPMAGEPLDTERRHEARGHVVARDNVR